MQGPTLANLKFEMSSFQGMSDIYKCNRIDILNLGMPCQYIYVI